MKDACSGPKSQESLSKMDTASLRALLAIEMDAEKDPDVDFITHILEELESREAVSVPDANGAWEEFKATYMKSDAMYPEIVPFSAAQEEISRPQKRKKKYWFRIAFVAAILGTFIFGASVTAAAANYDLWGAIARWTSEVFRFSHDEDEPAHSSATSTAMNPELEPLRTALIEQGIPTPPLPNYLPEGYVQMEFNDDGQGLFWSAAYAKGDDYIMIGVTSVDDGMGAIYEKDKQAPEIYSCGGIDHYIMTNDGDFVAVWTSGQIEYTITGAAKDELYKMIDSIYWEDSK